MIISIHEVWQPFKFFLSKIGIEGNHLNIMEIQKVNNRYYYKGQHLISC